MSIRKNLFSIHKIPYLKNRKNRDQSCILCQILKNNPHITNLLIYQGEKASVSLNLYPYNPGHLMVFPHRHITDIRELTLQEEQEISYLTRGSLDMLESLYETKAFNLGYNMGKESGASINHLHLHLVPRYPNESGFLDILSGAKLIVENPPQTKERLQKVIQSFIQEAKKKYL